MLLRLQALIVSVQPSETSYGASIKIFKLNMPENAVSTILLKPSAAQKTSDNQNSLKKMYEFY